MRIGYVNGIVDTQCNQFLCDSTKANSAHIDICVQDYRYLLLAPEIVDSLDGELDFFLFGHAAGLARETSKQFAGNLLFYSLNSKVAGDFTFSLR